MKIILTAAVSKLGRIGDIVSVKNGYAKNFLIPAKKAICLTTNNSKIFESKRQEFEAANDQELAVANEVKAKISKKDVIIIEKASDDGRLYGSVNSSVIATNINDIVKQKVASRGNVVLAKPIKEIGVYTVQLSLHSEVVIDVRLVIARGESEVATLLKADKKAKEQTEVKEEIKPKAKTEAVKEEATEEVETLKEEKAAE